MDPIIFNNQLLEWKPNAIHNARLIEEAGMIDICKCSCGWQSKPYYDGREYAYSAWLRHIRDNT